MTFTSQGQLDLYLTFKTEALSGTLLYTEAADSSFMELFLVEGDLHFMASCDSTSVLYVASDLTVNNGNMTALTLR